MRTNGRTAEVKMRDEKRAVEEMYGPWTAHNISLGNDLFTFKNEVIGDEIKLRRVVQIVADICARPISELRVLELACLEGMYGIEFSRQGAQVCAIEGREANLEKARFAARALAIRPIIAGRSLSPWPPAQTAFDRQLKVWPKAHGG